MREVKIIGARPIPGSGIPKNASGTPTKYTPEVALGLTGCNTENAIAEVTKLKDDLKSFKNYSEEKAKRLALLLLVHLPNIGLNSLGLDPRCREKVKNVLKKVENEIKNKNLFTNI